MAEKYDAPTKTGLLELLRNSSGSQFVIPVYQRNYSWTAEKDVKQYLNDLDCVIKGTYKKHFLGIVIYLEKTLSFSSREFSIIDGQQRLTTTFLIIYAIKKLLEKEEKTSDVSNLVGQYLTNPFSKDKVKYKLKPLVSDDDVYRCIVEDRISDIIDTKSNVYKNYVYICKHMDKLVEDGYSANDILLALDKLYVVTVPILEDENVQKIFESINATGEKLTAADLIRNFLLMDLDSDTQEDYYKKYWQRFEDNVSSDSKKLELFFRTYLSIKIYALVAKNNVYRSFVDWTNEKSINIKDLLEDLLKYAKIYNLIINEDISKLDKSIQNQIEDFRRVDSDMPLGLVMEFYSLVQDKKISFETLSILIQSVNSYLIRRSICDLDAQNISRLFPTVLKNTFSTCAGNFSNICKIFNQELVGKNIGTSGSYMPTDQQMYDILNNASVFGRLQLRTILNRLESTIFVTTDSGVICKENPAKVDFGCLSIEHLMPQTPTDEWLAELEVDEETYFNNLHRLGNLTLAAVHDNSVMSNKMWDFKKEILKGTAQLALNMPLIDVDKWDIEHINARTKELIEKICLIYPYPEVVAVSNTETSIVDEKTAVSECVNYINSQKDIDVIRKGKSYKTNDNQNGFIVLTSKMYPQGEKKKYWFGYREKRLEEIKDCKNKYLIMGCRDKETKLLKMPLEFLISKMNSLNTTIDENGEIKHYHIVIFDNPNKTFTMLLSKPEIQEIDISNLVID